MPQRRPNSRIISRNTRMSYKSMARTRVSNVSRVHVFAAFLCLCLLLLGLWTSYRVKMVADELKALEVESARLQTENQQLVNKHNLLISRANLEKLGRRLGLHPPKKNQLVFLK